MYNVYGLLWATSLLRQIQYISSVKTYIEVDFVCSGGLR